VDTDSWTFSIEVLSQRLIAIPPNEDPIPVEGEDPHPVPIAGLLENVVPAVAVQGALPDHEGAAAENVPGQPPPNQQFGNITFEELVNEMEAPGDFQENAQADPNDNNSALTVTNSEGEQSHNGPNIINEEVNQEQGNLHLVNPLELELLEDHLNEAGVDPVNGPVIVHGQEQALNMDNFMNLGVGVQNLMMAYHDIDTDSDSEQSSENSPMQEDGSPIGNQEQDMEFFQFNEVPAEVAHLQIGMVETFLFPLEDKEQFSEEGLKLWDKFFAPHIQKNSVGDLNQVLEIPVCCSILSHSCCSHLRNLIGQKIS
jgi:hypothetical protein